MFRKHVWEETGSHDKQNLFWKLLTPLIYFPGLGKRTLKLCFTIFKCPLVTYFNPNVSDRKKNLFNVILVSFYSKWNENIKTSKRLHNYNKHLNFIKRYFATYTNRDMEKKRLNGKQKHNKKINRSERYHYFTSKIHWRTFSKQKLYLWPIKRCNYELVTELFLRTRHIGVPMFL